MNWYSKGTDAIKEVVQARAEARDKMQPRRIWLKPNSNATLIYLDDAGFNFYEHAIEVPGQKLPVYVTCTGRANGCKACMAGVRSYHITLYSVCDTTKWVDNQGNEHKNEKRIHALKAESALALAEKSQRWGGLVGRPVIVTRKGQRDAAAGSDFEPVMKNGQQVLYKLDLNKDTHRPFDYEKIYAPKSDEEMIGLLQMGGYDVSRLRGTASVSKGYSAQNSGSIDIENDFGEAQTVSPQTENEASPVGKEDDVPF